MRRLLATLLLASGTVSAQTLAHPGWRGNGVTIAPWWKNAVIYEIDPRSFQDSNGDGTGDLKGITSRLDYLQTLGVNAIWLTPIYPASQAGFGYNLTAIDPIYGTIDDFDDLLREAARRNIRVLMDLASTATTSDSPLQPEQSKAEKPASPSLQPKQSEAEKPAPSSSQPERSKVEKPTDSSFRPQRSEVEKPTDSSFRPQRSEVEKPASPATPAKPTTQNNPPPAQEPQLEETLFNAARFWYTRGIAGFHLDATDPLFEDGKLRDEPATSQQYQRDLPRIHNVLCDLRRLNDSYQGQRVLIGEVYAATTAELTPWYGGTIPKNPSLRPKRSSVEKPTSPSFRPERSEAEKPALPSTPTSPSFRPQRSEVEKPASSTPIPSSFRPKRSEVEKPASSTCSELHLPMDTALGFLNKLDAAAFRTRLLEADTQLNGNSPLFLFDNHGRPRSWDRYGDGTHNLQIAKILATILLATRATALLYQGQELGMTTNPKSTNVEIEQHDSSSLYNWYQQLIALRRAKPALHEGTTTYLNHDADNALVWLRIPPRTASDRAPVLVAANLSAQPITLYLQPELARLALRATFLRPILRSDGATGPINLTTITLPPYTTLLGDLRN